MDTWVVVADAGRARFFAVDDTQKQVGGSLYAPSENGALRGVLEEVIDLENPAVRVDSADLASDEPGMQKESAERGAHGVGNPQELKRDEALRFAREIGDELDRAVKANRFGRLYVVAPGHFLGQLREVFSDHVGKAVVEEMDKDYTRLSPEAIRKHLPEKL